MAIATDYVVVGLLVGFLVGLTGIGGGALMTPILVLGFGINPAVAVGTDLIYAAGTKGFGVWLYAWRNRVAWRVAGALLVGSAPGSLLAIWLLHRLGGAQSMEALIRGLLSVALVLTSLTLLFKDRIRRARDIALFDGFRALLRRRRTEATVLLGFLLGVLVTFTSVGSGALGTAVLVMLYPELAMAAVIGTDLAHAMLLTGIAGLGHLQLGTVNVNLLASLLAGSLPGVYLGGRLGMGLNERPVRFVLASTLLFVGVRLAL